MNFADFQQLREKILRDQPGVVDCAQTNLYRALARLAPPPTPPPRQTVHRCHLAAEWCDRFGLSPEVAPRALVSCGVRGSLARLFRHYARENARLWLPSDNYPVYGELAHDAGCDFREFPTLPAPEWPSGNPEKAAELLVVTNPLKPRSRHLESGDIAALEAWLSASPRRRLLLDAVYTFDTALHASTLRLFASEQCLVLHSLTKGWLQPRLFGVTLVPERDLSALAPAFRESPPPQENLARARDLLAHHHGTPRAVAAALLIAHRNMRRVLDGSVVVSADAPAGYFVPVLSPWEDLLDRHGVLGIPASVFGSSDAHQFTILSTLSFIE